MYGMKVTMHIDEALLKRVVEAYGCESKTSRLARCGLRRQ